MAGLHDRLADIEVFGLHNPIGTRVVPGNANVMNPVTRSEMIQGGDVGRTIVGDDLL